MNYLALGELLIKRLEEITEFADVLSSEQLSQVTEENQSTPAAHVVYLGDVVDATKQGGVVSKVKQRWMVAIAVQTFDGNDTQQEAGELMGKVFEKLQGWKPALEFTNLHRESAGTPPLYKNGYGYFPLLFTTHMTIKGKRT